MTEPSYAPTDWHNAPDTGTPIDEDRLNKIEQAIKASTDRAVASVRYDVAQALAPLQKTVGRANLGLGDVATHDADEFLPASDKGAANGVATLDAAGKVSTSQLPSDLLPVASVADLTYPVVIPHRGGGNLAPENSLSAYEGAAALGVQTVEAGDLRVLPDGAIVCMHDSTLDRTTSNTGNVSTLTGPGARRLVLDASTWFGGGWPDQAVPLFDDVLDRIGGRCVLVPEVKDGTDAAAAAICARITARGLRTSAIVQSFTLSNCTVIANAGIAALFGVPTGGTSSTPADIVAAGASFVGVPWNLAGLAAQVASWHAVGLTVIAYTVDRQAEWDAARAAGCDGVFSNDPLYASRQYTAYRRSITSWAQNSTWVHGMVPTDPAASGPYTTAQRGVLVGAVGAQRWQPVRGVSMVVPGEVCPLPSPAGSYTITAKVVIEQGGSNTGFGPKIYFGCPTDLQTNASGTGDVLSSHLGIVRKSGAVQAWIIDAAGTATSQGTATTTALQNLTTNASMAAGTARTTLPVNALAQAVQVGHQWVLPTGQVVTATATAAAAATSVTVASFTPTATIASGTVLLQQVTITITVTPTNVTFARTDGTTGQVSYASSVNRGAYIHLYNQNTDADGGNVSFASVAVA